ncbi:MAG TPA: cobalamin-dependent protein, partial [Cyclobacteriaceae bacterium]|nr:cobalamin-dependent protein [Cyclobacteriaceae bacterium]
MSIHTLDEAKRDQQKPNLAGHKAPEPYKPKHKVRIVTAASLFDGHDAAINIMRRIIQATGCEVIHLGHDRSVEEVVNTAIQEDAQAIALTSYQGGHNEYFKYMFDLLQEKGAGHIKIFGGGGGVILPHEIKELMDYGITRIYSPDDGRAMGLQGMINDLVEKSDVPSGQQILESDIENITSKNPLILARLISAAENSYELHKPLFEKIESIANQIKIPVLGITGTGGAGKSSIVDEIVRRFLKDFSSKTVGIVSVDPSKRKTGGALLGDRIRMNSINNSRVYMRSLATRQSNLALSAHVREAIQILKAASFDLIILETSGIGQSDTEILDHSNISMYVMTPDYGAATQLEKIDMLDFADIIALNKFDKRGALDALRDVKKQFQRNHQLWNKNADDMPVYGTIASQFNDHGTNQLYINLIKTIEAKTGTGFRSVFKAMDEMSEKIYIIPPQRTRYLSEITEANRKYDQWVIQQKNIAQKLFGIRTTLEHLRATGDKALCKSLEDESEKVKQQLHPSNLAIIESWREKLDRYSDPLFKFQVRGKEIAIETHIHSLSHTPIKKISLPRYEAWGDILAWCLRENVPGEFPYTSGIYPFKREGEDPTRMFAGEGGP